MKLVFTGEIVALTLDDTKWTRTLARANFNAAKRKLLWMQNGGTLGLELDDLRVVPAAQQP